MLRRLEMMVVPILSVKMDFHEVVYETMMLHEIKCRCIHRNIPFYSIVLFEEVSVKHFHNYTEVFTYIRHENLYE